MESKIQRGEKNINISNYLFNRVSDERVRVFYKKFRNFIISKAPFVPRRKLLRERATILRRINIVTSSVKLDKSPSFHVKSFSISDRKKMKRSEKITLSNLSQSKHLSIQIPLSPSLLPFFFSLVQRYCYSSKPDPVSRLTFPFS